MTLNSLVLPQISRQRAEEKLRSTWWARLWREQERRLELVYLPHYLCRFALDDGGSLCVLCEGNSGFCSLLEDERALTYGNSPCPGEVLTSLLSPQKAREIAGEECSRLLLRHGIRKVKQNPQFSLQEMKELAFPYWVMHFVRRQRYDFRALDAMSGENVSLRLRRALLTAFIQ